MLIIKKKKKLISCLSINYFYVFLDKILKNLVENLWISIHVYINNPFKHVLSKHEIKSKELNSFNVSQSSEIVPDYFSDEENLIATASSSIKKKTRGDSLVSKK